MDWRRAERQLAELPTSNRFGLLALAALVCAAAPLAAEEPKDTLKANGEIAPAGAFSPGGKTLATGGRAKVVTLCDVSNLKGNEK